MRPFFLRAILAAAALASPLVLAQMHKVAKPEQVVRAVGVYEWTGDFTKPTASRLIPVSLFIEGQLQDAGVYIARPVPFALLSGNVYELQEAGIDKGMLDLAYARHLQAVDASGDSAYDDGWFGYGSVKPLAAPRRTAAAALKPSKTLPVLTSSKPQSNTASTSTDPDRPTMKRRDSSTTSSTPSNNPSTPPASSPSTTSTPATPSTTSTSTSDDPDRPVMKRRDNSTASTTSTTTDSTAPADDPDRPTMKRHDSSAGSDTTATSGTTTTPASTTPAPADDPDRPTLSRRSTDNSTASSGSTTSSTSDPSNDPDRPTLKRRSPEEARKARTDTNGVVGVGSLNDDPDRPNLHYGKPTHSLTETDLPKLVGLPPSLHQMVAVSDAVNRESHPFTLTFEDATQRAAVLQKMQDLARAQLAAYGTPQTKSAPTPKKTTTPVRSSHTATKPASTPPIALMDEELKAYTLSYGGDPTYIYSAHTAGTGVTLRYVTIVAQANGLGDIKPAIQNVTDAAHLDRTPHMRFVDVVDAEASNRASLLFELRGQNSRQFGLYRVIASHSDQIFATGTTQ
jgi:hypothetical protein